MASIFSNPRLFGPAHTGVTIEARLRLNAHQDFPSTNDFAALVRSWGLNNQSDRDQAAICANFLANGITCVSFPEDVGPDASLFALMGNPNKTYVAYDPAIIFVTNVR